MNKILEFILNRPVFVFIFTVLCSAILTAGVLRLEMGNTQVSELPDDDETVVTKRNIEHVFGRKDIILVGIECENIFTAHTLAKIRDIEEALKEIDGVISDETVSIVSVNNISGNGDGVDVGRFIQEIPDDRRLLDRLREDAVGNPLTVDRIVSADGRFSAIVANIEEGYSEEAVYAKVSEIVDRYSGPEYIFVSGDPVQQKEIDLGVQGDMRMLLPIALFLLVMAYYYSFRTALGVLLPSGIVLLSIVWTMGAVHFLGYRLTVVSSIIPVLMLVISSSYSIHIMQKFYDEYKSVDDSIDHIRRKIIRYMANPFRLTCITSALGMITLVIFKVKSIKEFGVIISLGSVFTYIITVCLVSSALYFVRNRRLKISSGSQNGFLNYVLPRVARFSLERQRLVIALSVLVLCISVFGVLRIRTGNDFIRYFPENHRLTVAYEKFNGNLGGADYIDIMFDGKNTDAVKTPDLLTKIDVLLKHAKATYSYVGNSFSIVDIVKRMNRELHGGDAGFDKIPDSSDEIAQYLLLYSMSGNPGDFNSIVDYDCRRTKVRMMLTSSDQDNHREIYRGLVEYSKRCFGDSVNVEFGGEAVFWLAQNGYIISGKIQNIIFAIIIVLILCSIAFRSFKHGIISIIPLTLSSLFTFGIMGLAGIRLETATALITSIGIGIGIDFAIHYISTLKREMIKCCDFAASVNSTVQTTGRAIVLDVLTTVLGFLVFTFSGFIPIQHFGWLITLTMIGSCVSSLVMFPAIIKLFKIKRI